jgi:hypothetical protein
VTGATVDPGNFTTANPRPAVIQTVVVHPTSSGGINQTVNQVTETDTVQSLTIVTTISTAVGQVTETDVAQSITEVQGVNVSLNQVTETDVAQVFLSDLHTTLSVNQVSETDEAQTLTPTVGGFVALNLVTETDSVQSITAVAGELIASLAQAEETNTASVITSSAEIGVALSQVTETNQVLPFLAQAGELVVALNLVGETEQAFSFSIPSAEYGGTYNASETFPSSSTVTITLYDPVTGATVGVDDNACSELPAGGVYVWDSSKLTTQPTGYQEYVWVMTDGIESKSGVLALGTATPSFAGSMVQSLVTNIVGPNNLICG